MSSTPQPRSAAMSSTPHVYTASHANETHANAVSIDLIEQSKENVQPLRRGRDPHALIKVLQQSNAANRTATNAATDAAGCTPAVPVACGTAVSRAESELKSERKVLEAAIKSYPADGPSPLAPWLAYLSWTRQNFLAGSTEKSHMLPLLEKCTRTFLRDARVNQSIDYLKVWIEYAEHVDDSLDMFAFMDSNGVARGLAQFYEAWAMTLERRGRNQAALDTLDMGAGRGATPAWRIKDAKARMQARIAKVIAAQVSASIEAGVAVGATAPQTNEQRVSALAQQIADENGTVVRQPLQRIGNVATREPMAERGVNGQTIYAAPAAAVSGVILGAPRPAVRRTNNVLTGSSNVSNFQVFDESAAPAASAAAASSLSSAAPPVAVWNEFASVSSASKENHDRAGSWNEPLHAPVGGGGAALAEGSVISLPTALRSEFPVFVDPECAAAAVRADASRAIEDAAAAAGSNPRKRLDPTALRATSDKAGHVALAKLTSQPLRNMNKTSAASSSSSSSSAAAPSASSSLSSSSTAAATPAASRSSSSSSSRSAASSSGAK